MGRRMKMRMWSEKGSRINDLYRQATVRHPSFPLYLDRMGLVVPMASSR